MRVSVCLCVRVHVRVYYSVLIGSGQFIFSSIPPLCVLGIELKLAASTAWHLYTLCSLAGSD